MLNYKVIRAGEGIRTLDVNLGNLTISRTSAGVHDNTNSRVVDPLVTSAESRGLAVTDTSREQSNLNEDRISLFHFAFQHCNRFQYDRLQEEASETLTQKEQRELVDAMINARFRIEGGHS